MSHPWRHHKTNDVLEVGVDVAEPDARKLVRCGRARDVADLVEDRGGGYWRVTLSDGNTKNRRSRAKAIADLRDAAW
jgi:hypothetical protein